MRPRECGGALAAVVLHDQRLVERRNLNLIASDNLLVTDHEILLPGLLPNTKYFYEVGTSTGPLAGDASYHFTSAPVPGRPNHTPVAAVTIGIAMQTEPA